MSKRLWFQLHGWFSLPVWVLFCFICVTGTVSVISHELTWLTNSEARANNPNDLPALGVNLEATWKCRARSAKLEQCSKTLEELRFPMEFAIQLSARHCKLHSSFRKATSTQQHQERSVKERSRQCKGTCLYR